VYESNASILLVPDGFKPSRPVNPTLLRVKDVYAAMATLTEWFEAKQKKRPEISERASIDPSAIIGENAVVSDFVVIGADCVIGANVVLHPFVCIESGSKLGDDCTLLSGVKVHYGCEIGNRVCMHANTVIGSDGFGYAKSEGRYVKIKQLGNVVIEDDVEIGANVVVDRASLGSTIIRSGAKLDNLIQIAHNVVVGRNTVIAAQAGVAGSTKVGDDVMIGGQVGIVGHIHVADGTQIQAQSGVTVATKANDKIYGSPALDYGKYLRSYAVFRNLPQMSSQLSLIEKKLKDVEKGLKQLHDKS